MGEPDLALSQALALLAAQARLAAADTTAQIVDVARSAFLDVLGLEVEIELGSPVPTPAHDRLVPICAADELLGTLRLADDGPLPPLARQAVVQVAAATGAALHHAQRLAEAERLARQDPLTGLLNRRALEAELGIEVHRARRLGYTLGVLMLDVDDFKSINDRFGHAVGDAALQRLAALLTERLRQSDRVARVGGEEFVVVLPGADPQATLAVARKLRQATAELPAPRITLSLGGASLPASQANASLLLERADLALYAAKRAGRNQVRLWEGPDV